MVSKYKIHPSIGVARLGNSPDDFCIASEAAGGLPIECDPNGNTPEQEVFVKKFRDSEGRIKRQAARFHIFVEDEDHPEGRPLQIGDTIYGGGNYGKLVAIEWRVYLANKKSVWYEFEQLEGEHGYSPDHPRRNADITDSNSRQKLIIDPGPQSISTEADQPQKANFSRGGNSAYAQTFPPEELSPNPIDTLGDIMVDHGGRLLVLGGHGNSGSYKTGLGEPRITNYANNDGWFDDTSDGPVMARLKMTDERTGATRYVDVENPAWVLCAYPNYVPSILDMITMEDVLYDLEIREFAGNTFMYGARKTFDHNTQQVDQNNPEAVAWWKKQDLVWNNDYTPSFTKDIWPILERPNTYGYLSNILSQSNAPHDETDRGTFDPSILSNSSKRFLPARQYLYNLLRQSGEENEFSKKGKPDSRTYNVPLMPLLCGDNPITNVLPSKFLSLTRTQLFFLKQWADGKFVDDTKSDSSAFNTSKSPLGRSLDRGIMANILGGAFCPGGEIGWIMRNPSIYREPYRIKADPDFSNFRQTPASAYKTNQINQAYLTGDDLSQDNDFTKGLQPGDLTKYMSIPWQADYNECTTQDIDITFDLWNKIYPTSEDDTQMKDMQKSWTTLWWPAHHPMQTYELTGFSDNDYSKPQFAFLDWTRGIPATNEGDLKMVTAWKDLGFVVNNPYYEKGNPDSPPPYISVERTGEIPLPESHLIS